MIKRSKLTLAAYTVLILSNSASAISPEDDCEAGKNEIAGEYALCRQNVEAKVIEKGDVADYSKCDGKLFDKWAKAEQKAILEGTSCIDSVSALDARNFVTTHTDAVAAALDGGTFPECGDDLVNAVGEQCDGSDLGGEDCTTLGFSEGTLACDGTCAFDTTLCLPPPCEATSGSFPATGQMTEYGVGSDGEVQAGMALSYTDNGDGTITDNNTGLMWEKKDDSGGIHDWNNTYRWCGASCGGLNKMDGDIAKVFLDTLNDVKGGGVSCFAGYCDWRIPNYKELTSIFDLEAFQPAVDPAFHQSATCGGCADITLATCSCTSPSIYWASSSYGINPNFAWTINFQDGTVSYAFKTSFKRVRAVRGGL